jgi:AcrR family transcriptional regulator
MVDQTKATRKRVDPETRRALIIAEAVNLIGEWGYNGFNLHDLAKRCGLSNGGVLYHFPSKEHVFLLMLEVLHDRQERALAPLVAQLEQQLADQQSSTATLRQLLHGIAMAGHDTPEAVKIFLTLKVEALSPEHPAYAYFQQVDAEISSLLTRACAELSAEPQRLARQLQAVMDGLLLQWLRENKSFDYVAEVEAAIERLLSDACSGHEKEPVRVAL